MASSDEAHALIGDPSQGPQGRILLSERWHPSQVREGRRSRVVLRRGLDGVASESCAERSYTQM